MKVLALSTYPIRAPLHGGQRRVAALGDLYRRLGVQFEYASIYASHYGPAEVGPNDLRLGHSTTDLSALPFVEDLQAGEFAARSPAAYAHFKRLFERIRPTVVTLEQPFMLPLLQRLRRDGVFFGAVVYSSQNWEPPLKEAMLRRAGISSLEVSRIGALIERLEVGALALSDLVIAVSDEDASIYRALDAQKVVLVGPNGVDPPPDAPPVRPDLLAPFADRRFFFFVGSAYPPNSEGFTKLVMEEGLYFVPPEKRFAVCGGATDQIFAAPGYQRFVGANSDRVQFFSPIDDEGLWSLKLAAHAILLPIQFGGGSNLKTAEALVSGKWMVTTSLALRGFEAFKREPGVLTAETPRDFRQAMIHVLHQPPLKLTSEQQAKRRTLVWEAALAASGAEAGLRQFLDRVAQGVAAAQSGAG